jgi:hypothetical protein
MFIILLAAASKAVIAAPISIDLTSSTWLVSGVDSKGTKWHSSTLIFETQTATGDNLVLTGYFDWLGSNGGFGRERFTGVLLSNREIELSGYEIVQPASGIGLTNYFAN